MILLLIGTAPQADRMVANITEQLQKKKCMHYLFHPHYIVLRHHMSLHRWEVLLGYPSTELKQMHPKYHNTVYHALIPWNHVSDLQYKAMNTSGVLNSNGRHVAEQSTQPRTPVISSISAPKQKSLADVTLHQHDMENTGK